MTRTINVSSGAAAGSGETISSTTYRLLAADGTTVLSTAAPPYTGVTDALVKLEQTAHQSDGQTAVVTHDIPGRVTDLAASNAAAPVLTWTDIGGETSYELHRGASGFTPDVVGHSTRAGTAAAGAGTFTDSSVVGNGSTVYGYRVVALAAGGYTIGNQATCTPAAPVAPTTIASDNFNRADNPTGLGTTPVGSKVWQNLTTGAMVAGLKIVGNQVFGQNLSDNCASVIDAGVTDVTVSATLKTTDNQNGVLVRVGDADNYVEAKVQAGGGAVLLRKIIGGSGAVIASPAATWVSGDTLTLTVAGNTFTVKQNGTTLTTVTDANALAANTKVGLTIQSSGDAIDDFVVTTP